MKKYLILISSLVVIILGIFLLNNVFLNKSDSNSKENTDNLTEESDRKKKNENIDEDLVKLIYEKGNILNYFDQDNLEYFEILDIWNFGYFESKSNIRYMQVNYDFKCKDGTRSCNSLDNLIELKDDFFSFKIAIDLNDEEYIEINPQITIHINSDWVST